MTGRMAGYCTGYPVPGYMNPTRGRGFGFWPRGGGRGRGWRHWYYATGVPGWARSYGAPAWDTWTNPEPINPAEELEALKQQAQYLEQSLADINKHIGELQSREKGK